MGRPSLNASKRQFRLPGHETGDGLPINLIGTPSSFARVSPVEFSLRNFYAGIYAEDGWRVSKGLTVNYGVRWKWIPFWKEALDRDPVSAPGVQSVNSRRPARVRFPRYPESRNTFRLSTARLWPTVAVAILPISPTGCCIRFLAARAKQHSSWIRDSHIPTSKIQRLQSRVSALLAVLSQPIYKFFFRSPFINRESGQQVTEPFPLLTGTNASTFNFSTYLPFAQKGARSSILRARTKNTSISLFNERLPSKTMLELTYDGSFGHHLTLNEDQNPASPALCQSLSQPSDVGAWLNPHAVPVGQREPIPEPTAK